VFKKISDVIDCKKILSDYVHSGLHSVRPLSYDWLAASHYVQLQ